MKIRLFFLILVISLVSCNSRNSTIKKRTETKIFGDSLKIVYTYSGDTIFQKRTDLKGKANNGIDETYDVISIWTTKKLDTLDCDKKIKITKNNLEYTFCLNSVLKQTQNQLDKRTEIKWSKDSIVSFKKDLVLFRKGEISNVSSNNYYMLYHFVKNLEVAIFDQSTQTNVSEIRMENYTTNFSGGNIYYLINKKQDTVAKYNLSDWMK